MEGGLGDGRRYGSLGALNSGSDRCGRASIGRGWLWRLLLGGNGGRGVAFDNRVDISKDSVSQSETISIDHCSLIPTGQKPSATRPKSSDSPFQKPHLSYPFHHHSLTPSPLNKHLGSTRPSSLFTIIHQTPSTTPISLPSDPRANHFVGSSSCPKIPSRINSSGFGRPCNLCSRLSARMCFCSSRC